MARTSPRTTSTFSWQHRPDRLRDIGRRERGGGDLVEERLEEMMVAPVNQRDEHRNVAQRLRRLEPGEAAADDDDVAAGVKRGVRRWLRSPQSGMSHHRSPLVRDTITVSC
jgi:hypothetical protein